jgi:hypothetical protein
VLFSSGTNDLVITPEAEMHAQKTTPLVDLLRENMLLRAEVSSLAEILEVAEETGQLPADWRNLLRETRRTRTYLDIAGQYESLFRELENVTDRADIEERLETVELAKLIK